MTEHSQSRFDAVVVGAGVIGLSCAWRAARAGASVCVVDAAGAGSGATGVAAGMLAPIGEAHFGEEALLALNLASHEAWPGFASELAEATGADNVLEPLGALHVALDRDEAEELRRLQGFQEEQELKATWLAPEACRDLEAGLTPRVAGGFHAPGEGAVDPLVLLRDLLTACRSEGVEVVEEDAVVAALGSPGRIEGVETASGREVSAGVTVLAAGCRSGSVEWLAPEHRPSVRPVKGEILTLGSAGGDPLCERIVVTPRVYLVPRRNGRVLVGATMEETGFDTRVSAGGVHELLREAYRTLPDIAEMEFVDARAGLRPATPSNQPLIGHGALEGLILATGHFRNGILQAPATAETISALIAGEKPSGPAAAFAPSVAEPGRVRA